MTRCAIASGAVACALLMGGCGPDKDVLPVIEDVFRYVSHSHPNPAVLHAVSEDLADAIKSGRSIKGAMDEIAASDDPYGQAIASAICTGLGQIADQQGDDDAASPTTADTWHDFLVKEVTAIILRTTDVKRVTDAVDRLTDTAALASINPRAAYTYYRECGSR